MLKITPYLGLIVLIVIIGGLWYPKLGYVVLAVFLILLAIAPFKGRWFCGNLCPRGSFHDYWIGRLSLKKQIPPILRSFYVRIPVLAALMGFMVLRIVQTPKTADKIGMVFVSMCILTTVLSTSFGIFVNPRTWCTVCPMGTMQRFLGGKKYQLQFDASKCVNCGLCSKRCPMGLKVNEISDKPDCIKCGRCVKICPKKALSF
jgi:ferredoxin-type protein NapH